MRKPESAACNAWGRSSTSKRSSATGGGTLFTGKCAGSTSTIPLDVANHRRPSPERHADGWLLVAVSLLRNPSAAPNSIQCEQPAPCIALPAPAQSQRAIPLPVANHRCPSPSSRIAWILVWSKPSCFSGENLWPSQTFHPWSCVPISSVPSPRESSAVTTLLESPFAVV